MPPPIARPAAETGEFFLSTPEPSRPKSGWEIGALILALMRGDFLALLILTAIVQWIVQWSAPALPADDSGPGAGLQLLIQFVLAVVIWPAIADPSLDQRLRKAGGLPPSLNGGEHWYRVLGALYGELVIFTGGIGATMLSNVPAEWKLLQVRVLCYVALVGAIYACWWSLARALQPRWVLGIGLLLLLGNLVGFATILLDPITWIPAERPWEEFLRSLCVPYVLQRLAESWNVGFQPYRSANLVDFVFPRELMLLGVLVVVRLGLGRRQES